jgi:peptidoglycan/LPS O-acetylase OafA/YrhL
MRFCAFLSVFFFHALPSNAVSLHTGMARTISLCETTLRRSGENGVALFFLLSAYLITELLRREKEVSGAIHLKMFYVRRALRIWPLYYLAIALGLIFHFCFAEYRLSAVDLLTYVFFLKNWDVVFRGWNWNPIYILWTVSAEEQFYLVWPLAQKLLNKRRLLMLCGVAMAVIPVVVFWPSGVFVRNHMTEIIFLFIYFPVGGILSLVLDGRRPQSTPGSCLALLAGGVVLWLAGTYLIFPDGDHESQLAGMIAGRFIILMGVVAVFFAFLTSDPRWSRRSLIYLGKISYGLYVFHLMALRIAGQLTQHIGSSTYGDVPFSAKVTHLGAYLSFGLALTIAAAALSYEFFEKRFLVLKDRFAIVPSRAV